MDNWVYNAHFLPQFSDLGLKPVILKMTSGPSIENSDDSLGIHLLIVQMCHISIFVLQLFLLDGLQ